MPNIKVEVTDYNSMECSIEKRQLATTIDHIEISVDNGRFSMSINGVNIYHSYSLCDGNVEVQVL